jgi:ribose transport system permease protein
LEERKKMSVETKTSVETKKSDEAIAAAAQLAATRRQARMGMLLSLTLVGLLALMWIVLAFSTTSFWTYNNISNLLRQGSMTAILAIGETFVIITAGIDLSVGAVVGFTSVIVALFLTNGFPIWAAIIITLAFGFGIGVFHAFGITKLGLPPFIMTLATLTALRGVGLLITNGATISITNTTFTGFSRGDFLGIQNLFWMVIVVAVPAFIFLHQSRFGRYLFAIGSNPEAARLSGVNTTRMIYVAYILSAVCASFVGILLASRIGIGNATQAEGWELQAIASSVIGGTSLFGAVGSVHGPLLGSFILTTINNGANLLNVNAFWQRIITGVLIIVIVYFDGLRAKKR